MSVKMYGVEATYVRVSISRNKHYQPKAVKIEFLNNKAQVVHTLEDVKIGVFTIPLNDEIVLSLEDETHMITPIEAMEKKELREIVEQ